MNSSGKDELKKMLILTKAKLHRYQEHNLNPEKTKNLFQQYFILFNLLNENK